MLMNDSSIIISSSIWWTKKSHGQGCHGFILLGLLTPFLLSGTVGVIRRCGILLPGLCSAANPRVITKSSTTPNSALCHIMSFVLVCGVLPTWTSLYRSSSFEHPAITCTDVCFSSRNSAKPATSAPLCLQLSTTFGHRLVFSIRPASSAFFLLHNKYSPTTPSCVRIHTHCTTSRETATDHKTESSG